MGSERGSTLVETIVGMSLLLVIAIGTIQVATLLYARNVIRSSAHEIARAAIERGVARTDAVEFGGRLLGDSLGGMIDDLQVDVDSAGTGAQRIVTAHVATVVQPVGPLPISVPVESVVYLRATAEPR